jgi:beta-fructofuranosidase
VQKQRNTLYSLEALQGVVDGGIVEVHINDRFSLSTWVWSWYEDSRNIRFMVEDGEVEFG